MKTISDGEFVFYIMFALAVSFVLSLIFGVLLGQWIPFIISTIVLAWIGLMVTYLVRKSKNVEARKLTQQEIEARKK